MIGKVKKILEKLKMTKELVLIIVAIVGFIISGYKMYDNNTKQLEMVVMLDIMVQALNGLLTQD